MATRSPTPFSFGPGFVQDRNTLRVIAQIDELADAGSTMSQTMKWVARDRKWSYFSFEWTAIRLWVISDPIQLFALGPHGDVLVGSSDGYEEEAIDDTMEGPQGRGPLRDLRRIGDHMYAAGMSRQVYRREAPGCWVHRDEGTVSAASLKESRLWSMTVVGFNSIDGLSEDDFFAVGFNGEIWRCLKGCWQRIESPTNVVLTRVRVVRDGLAYACGQQGVLLRGRGNEWERINHSSTKSDLWGIEWYRDRLYVAQDNGLFTLTNAGDLEAVDFRAADRITCGHLHANDGVLLSSGAKNVLWTDDGKTWHDITP
jgi:hypothetical protein